MNDIEYTMLKKVSGNLYLSQEQIDILDEYNIDFSNARSLKEIIFAVENVLRECDDDVLVNLLDVLSERDYYENYKK